MIVSGKEYLTESLYSKTLFCQLFFLISCSLFAQEKPPVPVAVRASTAQFLDFGAFTVGDNGGSVSVGYNGTRTWTNDIVLLNMGSSVTPGLIDVYANPGTIITIVPHEGELRGTNGHSIHLIINSFSTGETFITTADVQNPNPVYFGGTLTIDNPAANPAGKYSGTVIINFIQQ